MSGTQRKTTTAHFDFIGYIPYGASGITSAQMMYASNPHPPASVKMTHPSLTIVGSILKYSATPPQTPEIVLLVLLLYNLFSIFISS